MKYEKNAGMENYLSKSGLQILSKPFFYKMYFLCFDFKNTIKNQEFHFSTTRRKNKLLNQQMSSAGIGTADFFCNIYRFFCWIH